MELGLVAKTSRNVCIELKDTGIFYTDVNNYDIYINGVYTQSTNRVITSIYGLLPDTPIKRSANPAFVTISMAAL